MSKTVNMIIALALVSLFPALTLYAGLNAPTVEFSEEQAIIIATDYLKGSPTFSFDGIEDTIELIGVDTIRMPNTWSVTLGFESRHAGYGDRTDQILAQVITEHTMVIMVSNGEVIHAVTDDVFDELTETLQPVDTSLEEAEQLALDWLMAAPTFSFDGIEGSMNIIDTAIAESYPVQYFVTISFSCAQPGYGDRTGEILAQVITDHTARVVVSSGEVRSAVIDDTWDEFTQVDEANDGILSMEEAFDIVITYLREEYTEAESLELTPDWSIANLTPENLVGASTIEYSGDGWTITISYPVVWKPTYSFEVEHTSGFTWSGTVDQSGTVTETTQ
ncbi:MAG: hypothetical protein NWF07_09755 [Candidatus Bathyarchaeota archaeon]|nr:hypothetical protein [Candidatus Bathyarchaeota archaeon]